MSIYPLIKDVDKMPLEGIVEEKDIGNADMHKPQTPHLGMVHDPDSKSTVMVPERVGPPHPEGYEHSLIEDRNQKGVYYLL